MKKARRKPRTGEDGQVLSDKFFDDDLNLGSLAVKMVFVKARLNLPGVSKEIPSRLICYGTLPNKRYGELKIFEGDNCHIKFLLWTLQNLQDYKIDNRIDQRQLSIFTLNGTHKELPWLMRGLVKLTGRDTHFFGDLNKVKSLQHENISFYDLENYFVNHNIRSLSERWLSPQELERI